MNWYNYVEHDWIARQTHHHHRFEKVSIQQKKILKLFVLRSFSIYKIIKRFFDFVNNVHWIVWEWLFMIVDFLRLRINISVWDKFSLSIVEFRSNWINNWINFSTILCIIFVNLDYEIPSTILCIILVNKS